MSQPAVFLYGDSRSKYSRTGRLCKETGVQVWGEKSDYNLKESMSEKRKKEKKITYAYSETIKGYLIIHKERGLER